MAVSIGSFTVGAAGNYANWDLAIAGIDAAGLTGNLTFTQISDVVDTVGINTGGAPIPLGGFVLLLTSDTAHDGDINKGWEWDPFGVATTIEVTGNGTLEVSELKITKIFVINFNTLSTSSILIHDVLLYGDGIFGTQTVLGARSDSGGLTMYNCMSVNQNYHLVQQVFQFTLTDPTAPIRIFNNIAAPLNTNTNNEGFLISPANQVFTDINISNNVAATDSSQDGFTFGGVAPDASLLAGMFNNATTDAASLAGTVSPIQNFVTNEEFKSLLIGDPEYLVPLSFSQFKEAGTSTNNPTAVDIAGAAYGANPPLGAYVAGAAISIGSFTVGPALTDDYALWGTAIKDIANTLTGNLTGTQTGDTTESLQYKRQGATEIQLAGFTLLFDSDSPHAGVVGVGHISNYESGSNVIQVDSTTGGIFEVRNLQYKYLSGSGLQCVQLGVVPSGASGIQTNFHDLIFDGNGVANPFEFFADGRFNNNMDVYNILHTDADTAQVGIGVIRIDTNNGNGDKVWNCVIENAGTGVGFFLADMFNTLGVQSLDNLIVSMPNSVQGFGFAGFEASMIPARFMHSCASSDASAAGGTNAIINFVPATEFESLVKGNANYLVPKGTSQFKEAGAAVSTNIDMHGNAYGATPPIGAYIALIPDDLNITFQATSLQELKTTVDAWLAGSAANNIFTKALFEVQQDARNLGRTITMTLFYNGGGGALAAPFVLNFLEDTDISDINTAFEAFVVANPVAANFYGNLFTIRTRPGRKNVAHIYAFITNTDQANAGTNWPAANDIT